MTTFLKPVRTVQSLGNWAFFNGILEIMTEKRISFNEYDACMIYEWRLAVKQCDKDDATLCDHCNGLEKRLRDFIGLDNKRFYQRMVNKNPYCK